MTHGFFNLTQNHEATSTLYLQTCKAIISLLSTRATRLLPISKVTNPAKGRVLPAYRRTLFDVIRRQYRSFSPWHQFSSCTSKSKSGLHYDVPHAASRNLPCCQPMRTIAAPARQLFSQLNTSTVTTQGSHHIDRPTYALSPATSKCYLINSQDSRSSYSDSVSIHVG